MIVMCKLLQDKIGLKETTQYGIVLLRMQHLNWDLTDKKFPNNAADLLNKECKSSNIISIYEILLLLYVLLCPWPRGLTLEC